MTSDTPMSDETASVEQSESPEQPNTPDRRVVLKKAGMFLRAAGALAALNTSANAASEGNGMGPDELAGLWASVVSAADSFPAFKAFELYGNGLWIGSGQTDLTPAALASALWAVYRRVGPNTFHGVGRFWNYDASANPTGFASVDQITTVSKDGKSYHGEATLQFFDNDGNPLGPPTVIYDNGTRVA